MILSTDATFKRLDHYKLHEYARKWNMAGGGAAGACALGLVPPVPPGAAGAKMLLGGSPAPHPEPVTTTQTTSIDAMFKRKRGRPPKNRVVEVRKTIMWIFLR